MVSESISIRSFGLGVVLTLVIVISAFGGALVDRIAPIGILDQLTGRQESLGTGGGVNVSQKVLNEESVVIEVAEKISPSVVTVSVTEERQQLAPFFMDPFGVFGQQFFRQGEPETIQQDIGTGFVVDSGQGLVVTNKHVVSSSGGTYTVITKDDEEHKVEKIYRDPVNDIAILKVEGTLPDAIELGSSDNLKVGQFVIAIGTALGEFRHTVTTGVISGLGRGITAGDGLADLLKNWIM
jgi:S1-C subfamily serine protease